MREYELMFIVAQTDLKQSYHEQVIEDVRGWVEGLGGRVLRVRPWGLRQLAYPINDQDHGYYVIMQLLLPPSETAKVEAKFKTHERVVRHLLLQLNERDEGAEVDVLEDLFEEDEVEKIATGRYEDENEKSEDIESSEPKLAEAEVGDSEEEGAKVEDAIEPDDDPEAVDEIEKPEATEPEKAEEADDEENEESEE